MAITLSSTRHGNSLPLSVNRLGFLSRTRQRGMTLGLFISASLMLAGCGGSGSETTTTSGTLTFNAYKAAADLDTTSPTTTLTEAEQAEVATRTRQWATTTLVGTDPSRPNNAFVLPLLYFSRTQAVTAAVTLSMNLRNSQSPSDAAIDAGLMRGLSRTISAGANVDVSQSFMDAITARGQRDIWQALTLKPLTDSELAASPNHRMDIQDDYSFTISWPMSTVFEGVYQSSDGSRVQTSMVRVSGQVRSVSDGDMDAVALSLPEGRWLLRLTPTQPIETVSASQLDAMLAAAGKWLGPDAVSAAVLGELILPLSVTDGYTDNGENDVGGLVDSSGAWTQLTDIDGTGSILASVTPGYSHLNLYDGGMATSGTNYISFIFSRPDNTDFPTSGFGLTQYPVVDWVSCGPTDLRPSYFALIDSAGRIEMLARFVTVDGLPCSDAVSP
jgi:hypothetical protein